MLGVSFATCGNSLDNIPLDADQSHALGESGLRPPRPPPDRIHNLLRVQMPDVPVRRRQAGMPELVLNAVQRRPFVRRFIGVSVR